VEAPDPVAERLLEVLSRAKDLSSVSDELLAASQTWEERYHLDPARAHLLRPLQLDRNQAVLELGAKGGALTCYLGERAGLVDAVEADQSLAQVARQRTRDLGNVEVHVGTIDDVPATPAYDVVVAVDLLGGPGPGGGLAAVGPFLARAVALLKPEGTLVIGVGNALGVKFLCGAIDEYARRPFESVEGFHPSSPAQLFSREQVEAMVRQAGLTPTTLGVFPDLKLARLIFSDQLLQWEPELAAQIPDFPSLAWTVAPPRTANEGLAWANLVRSGLGGQTANAFLIMARREDAGVPVWPDGALAAYYPPPGRRAVYSHQTTVVRQGDDSLIERQPILAEPSEKPGVRKVLEGSTVLAGKDMVRLMADTTNDVELEALLTAWVSALDRAMAEGTLPTLDLLPHNALVTEDGSVVFIDSKWDVEGVGRKEILARAAYLTAIRLARLTSPSRWPVVTIEALALRLGALLGLPAERDWLADAVQREAEFQAEMTVETPDDLSRHDQVVRVRGVLDLQLAQPLLDVTGSRRPDVSARYERLRSELIRADHLIAVAEAQIQEQTQRSEAATAEAHHLGAVLAESDARVKWLEIQQDQAAAEITHLKSEIDAIYATRVYRWSRLPRAVWSKVRR
jgi:precorrin-6B methylase 2